MKKLLIVILQVIFCSSVDVFMIKYAHLVSQDALFSFHQNSVKTELTSILTEQ